MASLVRACSSGLRGVAVRPMVSTAARIVGSATSIRAAAAAIPAVSAPAARAFSSSVFATRSIAPAQTILSRPLAPVFSISSCAPAIAPITLDVNSIISRVSVPAAASSAAFAALLAPAGVAALPARAFHIKRKANPNTKGKNYRLKTHKGTDKRFHVTGAGKIMRWRSGHRHLLRRKSKRQLKDLNKRVPIPEVLVKKYRRSMPYRF